MGGDREEIDAVWAARPSLFRRGLMTFFCIVFAFYTIYVWTAGTTKPQSQPASPDVMAGYSLFQAKNCIACHQFYGLGGHMGPDLTNVISHPDKGPDYARAFIAYGTVKMPDYGLQEEEVEELVSFLTYVASSGTYPPHQPEINWNGTVDYDTTTDSE